VGIHIIIDGYNLIRQSTTLRQQESLGLEEGRSALLQLLRRYKKQKRHAITVVFDGSDKARFFNDSKNEGGIRVVFSRQGQTADDVMLRFAAKDRERALIVTSDRALVEQAEASGAVTISSQDFEFKLMSLFDEADFIDSDEDKERRGVPRISTRKKGPSKRLSRKQRKHQIKIAKL
jgi:predicted RNA-binding protein with PIN domain